MKHILPLFVLLFVTASCGTTPQSNTSTTSFESATITPVSFYQLSEHDQKEAARRALIDYCDSNMTESLMDYYKAYSLEFMYSEAKREFGAFENITFLTLDSGNYYIEASFITINSDRKYNADPKRGRINIVGIKAELNKKGEIISRTFYVSFIKNDKERFYDFDDSGLPTRSLYTPYSRY